MVIFNVYFFEVQQYHHSSPEPDNDNNDNNNVEQFIHFVALTIQM